MGPLPECSSQSSLPPAKRPGPSFYDPARKTLRAIRGLAAENMTAAASMAEHLTPGELHSERDLQPGTGAVIRSGLKKVATYRDDAGTIHRYSATCSHAGCIVHWNSFEQCWDCPCHGSHFAPDGAVLNAPAISGLEPVAAPAAVARETARS
jgi:Rieske Fe-S protein